MNGPGWHGLDEEWGAELLPCIRPFFDLKSALETRYGTDACFQACVIKGFEKQPRLTIDCEKKLRADGHEIVVYVCTVEIDAPDHKWADAWGAETWPKIQALRWFETCGWYCTPNRWRLRWLFDDPCGSAEFQRRNRMLRKAIKAASVPCDEKVGAWARVWFLPRIRKEGRNLDLPMDPTNFDSGDPADDKDEDGKPYDWDGRAQRVLTEGRVCELLRVRGSSGSAKLPLISRSARAFANFATCPTRQRPTNS